MFKYLHSCESGARSSSVLPSLRDNPKQLLFCVPAGSLGISPSSMPSNIAWHRESNGISRSAEESASRDTRRLPSCVSWRYLSFHCLKRNPPMDEETYALFDKKHMRCCQTESALTHSSIVRIHVQEAHL